MKRPHKMADHELNEAIAACTRRDARWRELTQEAFNRIRDTVWPAFNEDAEELANYRTFHK